MKALSLISRLWWVIFLMACPSLFAPEPPAAREAQAAPPPIPPVPPAPINFRQLLNTNFAGRETILATRSPEQRQLLQAKLQEYEALSPEEREARLCNLGLRLYLRPLLEIPISNRTERVESVPQPDRQLVGERLKFWDQLPSDVQREFLTNELVLRYVFRPQIALPVQAPNIASSLLKRIEEGINSWNQLTEQKRQEILDNFQRLFDVPEKEKSKILNEFTDAERQRMQRTLQRFEQLPKAQRDRCVSGFQKFAGLSFQEREQFLSNVEVWQNMNAQDRLAWRALVSRLSTPNPPIPVSNPPSPPKDPPIRRLKTSFASTNETNGVP